MLVLIGSFMLSMCGCGNQKQKAEVSQNTVENIETKIEVKTEDLIVEKIEETIENTENNPFSFADLKNLEFYFSSGAGAWRTALIICEDGSFSGEYLDSDMEIGENYRGVNYQCKFSGQFTQPVKVDEYTYSVQIERIEYEKEIGIEEIKDEVLYRYVAPYGLDDAKNILIYLPGTPYAELSEEFKMWVHNFDGVNEKDAKLPFYALNNEVSQKGFSSYYVIDN